MSYSPATISREYQAIEEVSDNGRSVFLLLHNDRDQAVAVCAEPEDVSGQQRHTVLIKIDLKAGRSPNEKIIISQFVSQLAQPRPEPSLADLLKKALKGQGIKLITGSK